MGGKRSYSKPVARDIKMHDDMRVSGLQGGKVLGDHLALFSFLMGIPLTVTGVYGVLALVFDLGFPMNNATIILVLVVLSLGCLCTIGGYFLSRTN